MLASEEICANTKIQVINVDDEEDCQRNSVLSVSRASVGEDTFDTIEQFGTMRNVKADGNCGYHAVIAALKHIKRECKNTVKEVRRDIREFATNRTYYLNMKVDL